LWIVDPDNFEIQVFDLRVDPDLPAVTLRQNDLLRSRFLPGFELPVSTVFQRF
jgi:Uma2 family endonuclease